MKPTTILFDMDGVIIDTESIWRDSMLMLMKKRGIAFEREKVKHLVNGTSMFDAMTVYKNYYHLNEDTVSLVAERRKIIQDIYEGQVTFIEGFPEFAEKVKAAGYKIAIGTASDAEFFALAQNKFKLSQFFGEHMYKIADVGNKSKPDPAIYLYAAEKLGSAPTECLVIEDSPLGIDAANNAGMFSIAITTSIGRDHLRHANLIVDSFDEVPI